MRIFRFTVVPFMACGCSQVAMIGAIVWVNDPEMLSRSALDQPFDNICAHHHTPIVQIVVYLLTILLGLHLLFL